MNKAKTWLPLDAVLVFLADNKYKTFAEILGATGDEIQHERATRMYMSSGVGRKKGEDGREEVVSLEELQKMSGLTLPDIVRKGRRRAIYETISKLINMGAVECKDMKQDPDLREYRAVKDWKPKPRGGSKSQSDDSDEEEAQDQAQDQAQEEARPQAHDRKKKKRRRERFDEPLEPEEPTPKVPFPIPKHVKDLIEYVELVEMGFPMAFKALTNGDRNDFARACRELKRIMYCNIFVPAPEPPVQQPQPALPPNPPPAAAPAASEPVQGSAGK